jgi:hypothetical protein
VFRDPALRALLLFGWLAGFYVLPEGLAVPYAHSLGGAEVTVDLLMAAVPLGTVIAVSSSSAWSPERVARSSLSRRRPAFLSGLGATTGAC